MTIYALYGIIFKAASYNGRIVHFNMIIEYRKIKAFAVLYAVLPIIIFFIGWLNIVSTVLFTALAIAAVYFFLKNISDDDGFSKSITLSKKQLILIAVIAFVWCVAAGQGSLVHQTEDHMWRNAVLRDMISHKWPVTYDGGASILSYYITHWMLPAVIGKLVLFLSGSVYAANLAGQIALLLWSSAGIFIVFLLLSMITNVGSRPRVFMAIFLFVFFSGLDIIGILYNKNTGADHLEWWAGWFQYSSNMTCLYWVYNQTIVSWIMLMCIMNETKLKNFVLFALLVFPYGPFPFVGLAALCLFKVADSVVKAVREKRLPELIKDALSLQNIIIFAAIVPVYLLFYSSNAIVSGDGTGFRISENFVKAVSSGRFTEIWAYVRHYMWFFILEAGLYAAVILRRSKPSIELIGMIVALLVIPLFRIGTSADFAMRVSIPPLVYLCVRFIQLIMKELPNWGEGESFNDCMKHRKLLIAALLIYFVGTFTPRMEVRRELFATITTPYSEIINYHSTESLQDLTKDNFVAPNYKDSAFYKLMCKKKND